MIKFVFIYVRCRQSAFAVHSEIGWGFQGKPVAFQVAPVRVSCCDGGVADRPKAAITR
jgi:hypothetical protein